jgi:hypothetical protein
LGVFAGAKNPTGQTVLVDIGLVHYLTHMSLTLARLCGEWQLVSGNYEARGASGRKYEAQIVIFRILAAVNRSSRISRKAKNRGGKSESH